ncbi:hypothetical protein V6N11_011774 [Hibiscus sabdariffa]|uniref:Uncharacterized protein n=1 Tax=Hibiscus sabdariffa TaxID=183260 RepID=A0ABR2S9A1_9ROSI
MFAITKECAPALDDPKQRAVAGVDLNHADIAGYLPVELGLLTDIAPIHLNSNRFCGKIPKSFSRLELLYESDVSNNRFIEIKDSRNFGVFSSLCHCVCQQPVFRVHSK